MCEAEYVPSSWSDMTLGLNGPKKAMYHESRQGPASVQDSSTIG